MASFEVKSNETKYRFVINMQKPGKQAQTYNFNGTSLLGSSYIFQAPGISEDLQICIVMF